MDASNELFPVFLQLKRLRVLLVGAGPVGLEKLSAIINNTPAATITIVAKEVLPEVHKMAAAMPHIILHQRSFQPDDLTGKDLAIIAVNNRALSEVIYKMARAKGVLTNVADTPDLCDFYLGSIVQRGHLKIAISTNGKSPTFAKRLRQWLDFILPENMDNLLHHLYAYRKTIKGDFAEKVARLDHLTSSLLEK